MEHVQPLNRPLPRRIAVLMGSAVVLATLAVLVLTHRPGQTTVSGHAPQTPPTIPLRPRSRISVLVLNGNGISGAAGDEATSILGRGYRHAIPTDAPSHDYPRSLVLFRPGWQAEAKRLARDARIPTVATLDGQVAPAYAHVPLIVILGAN